MSVIKATGKKDIEEDEIEISLINIVNFILESRKTVFYCSLTFLVVGIFYALSQENQFTATVRVMPELKTSTGAAGGLSDLKSLAGLAGVNIGNLNGTSEAIRPDLYPDIVQSVPFCLYLLKQSITTKSTKKSQTLEAYFNDKADTGILTYVGNLFGSSEEKISNQVSSAPALQLTKQQEALCKIINTHVGADMDKKSGIITITSQMPDAFVSAIIARKTLDYLTNYVTNYRTGKARQQVIFLTNQVNAARNRYEATEFQLSNYRDRNRNVYLNTAKIEEQRIQADYLLAQGVYGDLAKQLEQAKIKVQEEAPIFQVLEPARVPLKKSGPKRTLIVTGFTILGALLGLVFFFIKSFFIKNKLK